MLKRSKDIRFQFKHYPYLLKMHIIMTMIAKVIKFTIPIVEKN